MRGPMWQFFRYVVTKGVVSWSATGRVCVLLLAIAVLVVALASVPLALRLIVTTK